VKIILSNGSDYNEKIKLTREKKKERNNQGEPFIEMCEQNSSELMKEK